MNRRIIQQMKRNTFLVVAILALLCSCHDVIQNQEGEILNMNDQCVVTLGSIAIQDGDDFNPSTKAAASDLSYSADTYFGTTPNMMDNSSSDGYSPQTRTAEQTAMPEGSNFRLYAFPKGKIDIADMVNSKSFTIKNGLPTLDKDQGIENLYLPYGDLDIYIVGPAKAADGREIAALGGVEALIGDDVIASKTQVTVTRTSSNIIKPEPLSHRMAKVQVRIEKPDKAIYSSLELTNATILTQIETSPPYIFDEHGGSFTPTEAGEASIILDITEVDKGKNYVATKIVFPRKADRFKIEVIFGVINKNGENATYNRQSTQIENISFPAGEQTAFVARPEISKNLVYRPALIPWNAMDETVQSISPLALYLDGRDAPEEIDGKKIWRDKSGNGRHAIMNQDIPYNPTLQCYEFAVGKTMKLPVNEYMKDYTLEVVAITESSNNVPLKFENGKTSSLSIRIPDTGYNTYFDSGSNETVSGKIYFQISTNEGYYAKFHTYHFVKKYSTSTDGLMEIYCDGIARKTLSGKNLDHLKFLDGVLGNANIKIRSIRLYNQALNDTKIKANYETDLSIYQEPEATGKVATNGLLFYFDGKLPPYTKSGTFWPDRSPNANALKWVNINSGTVNTIVHNGTGYELQNVSATQISAFDLVSSAGTNQAFTFEFVCKGDQRSRRSILLCFGNNRENPNIAMRIFEENAAKLPNILYDAPYFGEAKTDTRLWINNQYTTWDFFAERFRTWTFVRTGTLDKARVYVDGKLIYEGNVNTANCGEMKNGRVGALDRQIGDEAFFFGEFKVIRGYNRALKVEEMKANRAYDAKRYGIKFSE